MNPRKFKELIVETKSEENNRTCLLAKSLLAMKNDEIATEDLKDKNIIYYIAGYAAHSSAGRQKCEACTAFLIDKIETAPFLPLDREKINCEGLEQELSKTLDRGFQPKSCQK